MDGSTDSGNIEEEVFLVMYLDTQSKDGRIIVCDKFLLFEDHLGPMQKGCLNVLRELLLMLEFLTLIGRVN